MRYRAALIILLVTCIGGVRYHSDDALLAKARNRITLSIPGMPVRDALDKLCSAAGVNCRVEPSVGGNVAIEINNECFAVSLDRLLADAGGLSYAVDAAGYRIHSQPAVDYKKTAIAAMDDLLSHFWNGSADDGNVMDPADWPDAKARGWLWGRATFICTLENLYQATRYRRLLQYLQTDWAYLQSVFSPAELVSVGRVGLPERMVQNTAHDDAGWASSMYLAFYRATRDRFALDCAKRLFLNAFARWSNARWQGAISYDDSNAYTTSYQSALLLAGIRLYELTGTPEFWDKSMKLYNWMETAMLRPDGLYWWVFENGGPRKLNLIREACSETFLGGNMAMCVVNSRLFRDTGNEVYRTRAIRASAAMLAFESDGKGCFLDDRDAWANGLFMGEYVRETLTLPGIPKAFTDIFRRSARAVYARARTSKGYYSGCWNGPAEGDGCAWLTTNGAGSNGLKATPEQLMVSSNAVNVIVAAAALEGRSPWPEPRKPPQ